MKTPQQTALVFLCIFSVSSIGYAWDTVAHMAVAGLAYDELTPEQQARLVAILKNHPKLNFITEGFPDPNIVPFDQVAAFVRKQMEDENEGPKTKHADG